jgi:transcriptional regulator with XRE-family HTH domain
MGLLDQQITAARLPAPERQRMIRQMAGASLQDIADEMERRGEPVSYVTVQRWERGKAKPRRARAIVYRQILDDLEAATG